MRFNYFLHAGGKVNTGQVDARNASSALEVAMFHTGIPEADLLKAEIYPVRSDPQVGARHRPLSEIDEESYDELSSE